MPYGYDTKKIKDKEDEPEWGTMAYCKKHGHGYWGRSYGDDIQNYNTGFTTNIAFYCKRCGKMKYQKTGD